jgi:hypothetical protein
LQVDRAAVRLHDFPRNRQTQAAAPRPGPRLIDLIEAFKDALGLFGRTV